MKLSKLFFYFWPIRIVWDKFFLFKEARIGLIEAHNSDLLNIIQAVQEEHVFIENLQKNRSYLQKALTEEVCKHQFQFQSLSKEFAELKLDAIAKCGQFIYFQVYPRKKNRKAAFLIGVYRQGQDFNWQFYWQG